MINEFENFDNVTSWVASTDASIHGLCPDKDFIAGNLVNSLVLKFSAVDSYCEKTYAAPIFTEGYSQLVIHVKSKVHENNYYSKLTDFKYKIELGSGKTYYLPTPETFCDITIDISNITSIEYIKVTYLGTEEDYLFLSYGCLVEDELPLDIFIGLKKEIDLKLASLLSTYEVGTITGAAGDKQLIFASSPSWINRYTSIRIAGTADEYHHIMESTALTYKFSSLFDGSSLVSSHTAKKVYLHFPCEYGKKHKEIILPSVNVWGLAPEPVLVDNDLDKVWDTWQDGKIVSERSVGRFWKYNIMIDIEARSDEVLAAMSKSVRKALGKYHIWVNGKKIQTEVSGAPVEIYPTDTVDIIPKIQFVVSVIVREEIESRVSVVATTDIDVMAEIL